MNNSHPEDELFVDKSSVKHSEGIHIMRETNNPPVEQILSQKNTSDVKKVTDLCELSLTDGASIEDIATEISEFDSSKRPTALKKLSSYEIVSVIEDWRDNLRIILKEKHESNNAPSVMLNNVSGNSADSDLIVKYEDGVVYPIEVKFGKMTNGNSGVSRISSILSEDAFVVKDKELIVEEFFNRGLDEKWLMSEIRKQMTDYAMKFNVTEHNVNSSEMFDILHSSGAQGNSASEYNENYTILTFGQKKGKGTISETTIDTRPDDEWDVVAIVSPEGSDTMRLNYIFTNRRDETKTVRATFNNKNSTYATSDGDIVSKDRLKKDGILESGLADGSIVQFPSKFFMGSPSYNVWFKDKNRD